MKKHLTCFLFALICFASCTSDPEGARALVNVFLVDAPGEFESVFVEVLGVDVSVTGGVQGDPSTTLFLPNVLGDPQVNLTTLVGGERFLVGRGEFLTGNIVEMTLKLGNNNTVVVDGETYPLTFEPNSSGDIAVAVNMPLVAGVSHDIFIDFEVLKSIQQSPTIVNNFILTPKLRIYSSLNTGSIAGTIRPQGLQADLYGIQGLDTITTTSTSRTNGNFVLGGLTDTLTVSIVPRDTTYASDTLTNIVVVPRVTSEVGSITLERKSLP